MTTTTPRTSDAQTISLRLLDDLIGPHTAPAVGVRLWDGTYWPDNQPRAATLALKHPGALRAMFLPASELGLAEAYLYDDFDIEGDIEKVFDLVGPLLTNSGSLGKKLRITQELLRLPVRERKKDERRGPARLSGEKHSPDRDRQAIAYHYDVSNDFYPLFLDRRLVYSCAYFENPEDDLDRAQEQKLDYICRKLRLQPGQRLLDIGCGWGGFITYAAEHYGVQATGVTLSQAQYEYASQLVEQKGLAERVQVRLTDYRELPETEPFDALVSISMYEAVGEEYLEDYFQKLYDLLRPGGALLHQGIARRYLAQPGDESTFSETYVFPDGALAPISDLLVAAETAGFEVQDVENLRPHYLHTLRHWVRRLEANHQEALRYVDETTYRVWRLYMSGSAHGFLTGRLKLYHALLVRLDEAGRSPQPLTRAGLYQG